MKRPVALLFFCGMLAVVTSQDGFGQVYCGRRLASTLAMLCENTLLVKRGMAVEFEWPWIGQQTATALGRSKRQVVSECCGKPCAIDELLSYC
ncbi:unnamed protein product, partial [Iphiclides podalirius]